MSHVLITRGNNFVQNKILIVMSNYLDVRNTGKGVREQGLRCPPPHREAGVYLPDVLEGRVLVFWGHWWGIWYRQTHAVLRKCSHLCRGLFSGAIAPLIQTWWLPMLNYFHYKVAEISTNLKLCTNILIAHWQLSDPITHPYENMYKCSSFLLACGLHLYLMCWTTFS